MKFTEQEDAYVRALADELFYIGLRDRALAVVKSANVELARANEQCRGARKLTRSAGSPLTYERKCELLKEADPDGKVVQTATALREPVTQAMIAPGALLIGAGGVIWQVKELKGSGFFAQVLTRDPTSPFIEHFRLDEHELFWIPTDGEIEQAKSRPFYAEEGAPSPG